MGEINLAREMTRLDNWKFGFDWKKQSEEQLEKVFELHNAIQEIEKDSKIDESSIKEASIKDHASSIALTIIDKTYKKASLSIHSNSHSAIKYEFTTESSNLSEAKDITEENKWDIN